MITKEFILQNVSDICKEGVEALLAYEGTALEYLREDPRRNRAAAFCILYGNEKIRACREIAQIAVEQDGFVLHYLPESLKSDRELVKIAVAQSIWAFYLLPESLKSDQEILKIIQK